MTADNRFDVISIDWPWNFQVYSKDTGRGRSAAAHYDTDSLTWDDWQSFVQYLWPLMAENCALCLWMVRPSQDEAMEMVKYDWNDRVARLSAPPIRLGSKLRAVEPKMTRFKTLIPQTKHQLTYKTELFTLYKHYRDESPFVGMGYYSRANTEPCMLYVRGKMSREDAGVRQVLKLCPYDIPKDDRHSYKPPEYRRCIERLWPNKRYLEIFAREDAKEPGWTYLGNEVTGNDIRHDLKQLAQAINTGAVPELATEVEYRAAA